MVNNSNEAPLQITSFPLQVDVSWRGLLGQGQSLCLGLPLSAGTLSDLTLCRDFPRCRSPVSSSMPPSCCVWKTASLLPFILSGSSAFSAFSSAYLPEPWWLGRGTVIKTSHVGLAVPKLLTLWTLSWQMSALGPICKRMLLRWCLSVVLNYRYGRMLWGSFHCYVPLAEQLYLIFL